MRRRLWSYLQPIPLLKITSIAVATPRPIAKWVLAHIGHLLSCNRDAVYCQGYDARIKMTRTQMLMKGATHCDFRYRFDEDNTSDIDNRR